MESESKNTLHELWARCVDLPGYNKKHWGFLHRLLDVASFIDDEDEFVLYLARLYAKDRHNVS